MRSQKRELNALTRTINLDKCRINKQYQEAIARAKLHVRKHGKGRNGDGGAEMKQYVRMALLHKRSESKLVHTLSALAMIVARLDSLKSTASIQHATEVMVSSLKYVNHLYNCEAIQNMIQSYGIESARLQLNEELMDGMFDSMEEDADYDLETEDNPSLNQEVQEVVDEILSEVSLEERQTVLKRLPALNVKQPTDTASEDQETNLSRQQRHHPVPVEEFITRIFNAKIPTKHPGSGGSSNNSSSSSNSK